MPGARWCRGGGDHGLFRLRPCLDTAAFRHAGHRQHGEGRAGAQVRQLYAMLDGTSCRAAAVRRYSGETAVEACGQCDLCLNPPEATDVTVAAQAQLRLAVTCLEPGQYAR